MLTLWIIHKIGFLTSCWEFGLTQAAAFKWFVCVQACGFSNSWYLSHPTEVCPAGTAWPHRQRSTSHCANRLYVPWILPSWKNFPLWQAHGCWLISLSFFWLNFLSSCHWPRLSSWRLLDFWPPLFSGPTSPFTSVPLCPPSPILGTFSWLVTGMFSPPTLG